MPPPPTPKHDKPTPSRPLRRPLSSQHPSSGMGPTVGSPPRLAGMAVSPTDAAPALQPRPKGPGGVRPKRASWAPSSTPSPRLSPALRSSAIDRESGLGGASGRSSPERFTGTLAERTDDELMRASREALQDALRKEWSQNEKLVAQVDELDTAQRAHDARISEMETANNSLQAKFDASFVAQGDLEDQLEGANDIIERLRRTLDDVERALRLQQRRYADQEKAFDAERTVHHAEQNHLVLRIKSLTNERIARPSDHAGDRSSVTAALHEELVTLSASHQTLVAQLTTLADEMHEVKGENARLQEENESWQLLIEERTLAGHMRGGLIPGMSTSPPPEDGARTPSSIRRKEPSALETLEEQLEMDELHSELDAQQPIFEDSDRALLRVSSGGSHNLDITSPTRNGNSLATELGAGISMAVMESLRSEIKTLKEGNKALSLYCSKILDRIIASEGYEHVLSVDYRTRRGTRGTRSAAAAKLRPSVIELAKDMQENASPPMPDALPPASKDAPPSPPVPATRARPQSMYATSAITSVPAGGAPPAPPRTKSPVSTLSDPKKEKIKEDDKRARRGFSIDFRSLGFGAQEKPEAKPQLKPLQLASRAAPAGASPPKTQASPIVALGPSAAANVNVAALHVPGARKLAPQEEDEEDRRERSRMEASLKLMGITSPQADTGPQLHEEKPATGVSAAAGWLSRRLSRASVPVTSPSSRCSGALSDSTNSSRVDLDQDPEAAMRAYDAREREQARLLAEGKSPTAFTAAPKLSRRNRSSNGSTLSRNSAQSFSMTATSPSIGTGSVGSGASIHDVEILAERSAVNASGLGNGASGHHHHRARESISTLWSIGSSHDHDEK